MPTANCSPRSTAATGSSAPRGTRTGSCTTTSALPRGDPGRHTAEPRPEFRVLEQGLPDTSAPLRRSNTNVPQNGKIRSVFEHVDASVFHYSATHALPVNVSGKNAPVGDVPTLKPPQAPHSGFLSNGLSGSTNLVEQTDCPAVCWCSPAASVRTRSSSTRPRSPIPSAWRATASMCSATTQADPADGEAADRRRRAAVLLELSPVPAGCGRDDGVAARGHQPPDVAAEARRRLASL